MRSLIVITCSFQTRVWGRVLEFRKRNSRIEGTAAVKERTKKKENKREEEQVSVVLGIPVRRTCASSTSLSKRDQNQQGPALEEDGRNQSTHQQIASQQPLTVEPKPKVSSKRSDQHLFRKDGARIKLRTTPSSTNDHRRLSSLLRRSRDRLRGNSYNVRGR